VDVRIGVTQSVKEIEVELADDAREKTMADITSTVSAGEGVLWLTDKRGRTVGIPAAKIAYVEIGGLADDRRVGFAR
jgi:hypothetical protein